MTENFGYIDIILLAMLAGFIFLRLRNVLGKGADDIPIKPRFNENKDSFSINPTNLKKDKETFDKKDFIKGAEAAYEMIIGAFAKGDKNSLKPLLTENLYSEFSKIIDERKTKQITSELTFIGIKETKIAKIDKEDTHYKIKTKFTSEIVNCLKNNSGMVIEGDPEKIKTVTDVWIFEKDLKDKNPTWYLTELSSDGDEKETKH